jgi:hypothetical protein
MKSYQLAAADGAVTKGPRHGSRCQADGLEQATWATPPSSATSWWPKTPRDTAGARFPMGGEAHDKIKETSLPQYGQPSLDDLGQLMFRVHAELQRQRAGVVHLGHRGLWHNTRRYTD